MLLFFKNSTWLSFFAVRKQPGRLNARDVLVYLSLWPLLAEVGSTLCSAVAEQFHEMLFAIQRPGAVKAKL